MLILIIILFTALLINILYLYEEMLVKENGVEIRKLVFRKTVFYPKNKIIIALYDNTGALAVKTHYASYEIKYDKKKVLGFIDLRNKREQHQFNSFIRAHYGKTI